LFSAAAAIVHPVGSDAEPGLPQWLAVSGTQETAIESRS